MRFEVLLTVIYILQTKNCQVAAFDITTTLTILNELSRILGLYTNRQDFNKWFATRQRKLLLNSGKNKINNFTHISRRKH